MTKTDKKSAAVWQQRFENRKQALAPMFENAQKYYDIMYAVQNTTKISPWKSKVYVPVLAGKAWDLIARMSDVVPLFNVSIQNELEIDDETLNFKLAEGVEERQRRIEAKLHADYVGGDEEPMKLRVFDPLVDAVVAGTGYAYAPWVFEEKKSYARQFDDQGLMDNENVVVKKTLTGHNGFEGVNFYNVFPAAGASFFKIPYLIIRGESTLVDMNKSGIYKNLDKVDTKFRSDDKDLYNISRNRIVNEQVIVDESVELVTYYECYERCEDGIYLTTYAEGQSGDAEETPWVEIRTRSKPYWHDFYPLVPFYCRRRSFSPFGESLFENNRTMQSATNDLFNHYLDNWNLSIESMLMYEDGSLTNDFIIEPGGEITYTGEKPTQFKFPEPNPQQLSVVLQVLEKGVENATFSNYASGVPDSKTDKTQGTAYGVRTITEAATTKIGFFRDNFKQSMRVVGQIWVSNLAQFADEPSEIRRVTGGKEVPDLVVPSDYQGEIKLDIDDDSMTPLSKAEKRDMNSQFTQEVISFQKAAMDQAMIFKDMSDIPRLNFHEMLEDSAELYSKKDFNRYLLDSTVEIPQEEEPDNTKEYLNFSYKDAPSDVKSQIEEMYGLQPSAMHDTDMVTQAAEAGLRQAQAENPVIPGEFDGQSPAGAGSSQPTE
jgi:hypothetical protein